MAAAREELFAGAMSGTSLDGVDLAIVDLGTAMPRILAATTLPFPEALRAGLLRLCHPGEDRLDLLGSVDVRLARLIATGMNTLLEAHDIEPTRIRALGSHGQTVRHQPGGTTAFSLQIGDPNLIAEETGLTVVADFRRRDMAAGGEGAPLVPAFHAAVFGGANARVVVNIGGMANITVLPAGRADSAYGFDTGPGNMLLDIWASRHLGAPMDASGAWAAQGGPPDPELLHALLAEPYFARPAPKSTGRELFNADWLNARMPRPLAPAAVQSTLTELTARSIAAGILDIAAVSPAEVLVCGGGRHNALLLERLAAALPGMTVTTTDALGLDGDWVEAAAFGWLARQRLLNLPGNLPAVTGARGPRILGAVYPGGVPSRA